VKQLIDPDTTVVTGAGGWLGTALVHSLCAQHGRHHERGRVIAVVQNPSEMSRLNAISPLITSVVADITRNDSMDPVFTAVTGTTDLIHTAGVIHPRRCAEFTSVNTLGTRHVLEAAQRSGVRRVVHVSSNSPFGTNPTPRDTFGHHEPYHPYLGYGSSKMEAELCVLEAVEAGLDAVIVRPPWFYGPWQPPRQTTFFRMVRTGRFPILGSGEQRRSMVHVDNLVHGLLRAGAATEATGQGYWIADAEAYTINEIVATVQRALTAEGYTCSSRQLRLPALAGHIAERVDRAVQATGRYHQQIHVLGELSHTIAVDISAAREQLGYAPEISLYEGMRSSIRWCQEQGLQL
jgi:nucleoside-diphosphate-sugar epimerase